ncbi:MAG TPA: metallophosphoesterase family protein, partial [Clostridia bacterium]|nr:metallophosphoesterase family protein [Clostridia bacterium]
MPSRISKDSFVIGVISDTHGLLRPEAERALRGSQLILHAGDIGSSTIVPALRRIAPAVAIRGNIDVASEPWVRQFHATEVAEAREKSFYLIHNVRELDLKPKVAGLAAVIFGHSHKPEFYFEDGVL